MVPTSNGNSSEEEIDGNETLTMTPSAPKRRKLRSPKKDNIVEFSYEEDLEGLHYFQYQKQSPPKTSGFAYYLPSSIPRYQTTATTPTKVVKPVFVFPTEMRRTSMPLNLATTSSSGGCDSDETQPSITNLVFPDSEPNRVISIDDSDDEDLQFPASQPDSFVCGGDSVDSSPMPLSPIPYNTQNSFPMMGINHYGMSISIKSLERASCNSRGELIFLNDELIMLHAKWAIESACQKAGINNEKKRRFHIVDCMTSTIIVNCYSDYLNSGGKQECLSGIRRNKQLRDIFTHDIVFFPLCHLDHWTLLVLINLGDTSTREYRYCFHLDSKLHDNVQNIGIFQQAKDDVATKWADPTPTPLPPSHSRPADNDKTLFLENFDNIMALLVDYHAPEDMKERLGIYDSLFRNVQELDCPQQYDAYSCGDFVSAYIECLAKYLVIPGNIADSLANLSLDNTEVKNGEKVTTHLSLFGSRLSFDIRRKSVRRRLLSMKDYAEFMPGNTLVGFDGSLK